MFFLQFLTKKSRFIRFLLVGLGVGVIIAISFFSLSKANPKAGSVFAQFSPTLVAVRRFLGIELVKDRKTRERAGDEAEEVMYAALSKGLSFKTTMGNILTLTPALTITKEEMDAALDIIEECIADIERS